MAREIRPPAEDERIEAAQVMRVSLNLEPSFIDDRAKVLPLADMQCAFEDGRLLATSGERRFTQWFGGRELAMSGIWGVATLPEHRGRGLASAVVMELLRGARERGDPLTALYPAILQPYRRLGYALGGSFATHEVRIDDLPRDLHATLDVVPYERERDLEDVRACYRRAMTPHNGPIDSEDPQWWPDRILGHWRAEDVHRVVVVRGPDGVEGYASFVQQPHEGDLDIAFRLDCKHLVAGTPDAYRSLIAYVRGFAGVGQALRFVGRPDDPMSHSVEVHRLRLESNYRWMLRLLNVASAFEGRGYPPVSGELAFEVDDPHFEENRGPWRLVARGGDVTVEPSDRAGITIDIRAISAMYTGYLTPSDAARIGWLAPDEHAIAFLGALLRGPAPFMLDFF